MNELNNLSENQIKVQVGWYAFGGGKFAPNADAFPNLWGVVAWLNPQENAPIGKRGLILLPDEVRRQWATTSCITNCLDVEDGQANTQALLALGKEKKLHFPAAEWCAQYSGNGIKPGDVFLPAQMQLHNMVANLRVVNEALAKIDGMRLHNWVWSSTDGNYYYAWGVGVCHDKPSYGTKYYHAEVRAVLAF